MNWEPPQEKTILFWIQFKNSLTHLKFAHDMAWLLQALHLGPRFSVPQYGFGSIRCHQEIQSRMEGHRVYW